MCNIFEVGLKTKLRLPFTSRCGYSVKAMSQMMFIPMITYCAQVIICAFCTFPSNTNYWLLTTSITHGSIMLNSYKKEQN